MGRILKLLNRQFTIFAFVGISLTVMLVCVFHFSSYQKPLFTVPGHAFDTMTGMNIDDTVMPMVESTDDALSLSTDAPVSKTGWTAVASDSQTGYSAAAAIDGDDSTIWHSNYAATPDTPLPHSLTIDMKQVQTVSRLTYTPRQTGLNGQIGQYKIYTSLDNATWGIPVAEGTWADAPTAGAKPKQYADFRATPARFLRIVAYSEAGNRGPWSSVAEIGISGSPLNYMAMPRTNWTVSASDSASAYPVSNAIDVSKATFWHSDYAPAPDTPLPHSLTIDTHTTSTIRALGYLPRQDGVANGRIGSYQVAVSQDNISWTTVKSGSWIDDATEKAAVFTPVSARYIRLTGLTEAGNRGPWTTAAMISLYDTEQDLPTLSRSGWTVTASDQAAAYTAANLLDGNSLTIWHSNYDTDPDVPLPHSVTIDMKVAQPVSGLTYVPRQDAGTKQNGTIGRYAVDVSKDNVSWTRVDGNTWADNLANKTTRFPLTTARYIKLTALSEAGNRGPWSAASEIYVHGVATKTGDAGSWGNIVGFPLVPTSGAMLPNNKLLVFSAYTNLSYTKTGDTVTKIAILDLATNTISQPPDVNTNHQMFCTGLTMLADGRLLINGGSADSATTIYNPFTNTWIKGPLMNIARAYNSTTLLSDGRAFTLGGSWKSSTQDKSGEAFKPSGTTGVWSPLPNITSNNNILTADPAGQYRADNHAWLFSSSNGTVFHAGPSKQMNWITTSGTGTIKNAGTRADNGDAMNGNAVMYDVGKILTLGGAAAYQDGGEAFNTQAYRSSYKIDISGGIASTPSVSASGPMAYQRVYSSSVALPDGNVLVVGGQQHPAPFTDTSSATAAELWSPQTNTFRTLASETVGRNYHSLALLLPDGRIFSGGGGLCGTCTTNHTDAQIFTPPYLLNTNGSLRARPTISAAPATITKGTTIAVTTSGGTPAFSLIRMSAATHSVNNDQRRIPLGIVTTSGNTYSLAVPSDPGVVLPGYYMLFAMDATGTPSISKIVKVQ